MFPNLSSLVQQVPQGRKNKTNPYGVLRAGDPILSTIISPLRGSDVVCFNPFYNNITPTGF